MTYTSVGAGNVSIVIPCYNQGATLREALASVEQVRNENVIDVIIVDDGSSEAETIRILKEVAEATALWLSPTAGSVPPEMREFDWLKANSFYPWTVIIGSETRT
jgi:GT2 family glycosyltransferase